MSKLTESEIAKIRLKIKKAAARTSLKEVEQLADQLEKEDRKNSQLLTRKKLRVIHGHRQR
jgi:hypothetical protein